MSSVGKKETRSSRLGRCDCHTHLRSSALTAVFRSVQLSVLTKLQVSPRTDRSTARVVRLPASVCMNCVYEATVWTDGVLTEGLVGRFSAQRNPTTC